MALPRLLLSVVGVLTGVALAPAGAQAALPWAPCAPAGFECAGLAVPLDRSGATPGTLTLSAKRVPAAANPGRVAVVALAGGPGQAALPIASGFAASLGPAIASRDLLVYDQRGTGASNPLDCAALRSGRGTLTSVAASCSDQLGPARAFFRTAESVQDIEALRVAGEYEKLVLYGVSYGTKVAEAYASAYPSRVESLVLDSVVTPEGPEAFRRSSLTASPRVVDEICAANRCRGITASASRDLATLARRLRTKPLKGAVYSPTGRRFTASLTESGLFGILLAGDLNPTLRAELPGSMRAALAGDVKPLLRLSARSAGLENAAGYQSSRADSDALFLATTCEENATFPWTRGASATQRRTEAERAARGLPAGSTGPFSSTVALRQGILPICLGWKTASPAPVADAPLPAVPLLAIAGRSDLRTPLEDATAVAARVPGAQVLAVPNSGHSVLLGSDTTDCSKNAIAAFFAGQPVAPCADAAPRFRPTPRPATRASRLTPYGAKGKVGRTIEALRVTINDAQRQVLGEALALGRLPAGAGGLRSGYVRVTSKGLSIRAYEYVPDVTVTGTLLTRGTSTFRVSGSQASRGTVKVTASLRVTGTLGGKRVKTGFGQGAARADRPFDGLTLAQAVARGKRIRAAIG
jgi:pimeloyl-ACP methyl ester carboxylesterase